MSPLFAWAGAVISLLVALMSGLPPGVLTNPADGATSFDAASVRQSGTAAAAAPPCPVGWTDADTSYARSILASVVSSGTSAWAIGLTTVSEDPRYPIAVRWDGHDWVAMPIEASSAERALFGLDRTPTGRLWAAGYRAKSSLYYPMMMRWNGSTWVVSPLGSLGRRGGALLSVRALSDTVTWAVGYKVSTSGQRPVAVRRVGSAWREASPSIATDATGVLMDVDASSSTNAWGVGWVADRGAPRPYLAHWNGRRWTNGTPVHSGSEGALTSVAIAAADDVWAVGYQVVGGIYRPSVQHWDGHRWRLVAFPRGQAGVALLRGVQIGSDGEPVVVGTRWDAASDTWRGLAARWQDGEWHTMDTPSLPGGTELRDLATRADGTAWVVGANGGRSLAVSLCPAPQATTGGVAVAPTPGTGPMAGVPSPVPSAEPSPEPSLLQTVQSSPAPSASPNPKPTPKHTPRSRPTPTPPVIARDVTRTAGLARDTASYGAVRADFNGDGWPDLFIGRHSNPGWLVLNDHGTFVDAPGVTIPKRDRHGCTTGDVNGDKRPDLYCANGAFHGAGFKGNELYVQQPDGTFAEQGMALHATDPFGRGRLSALFDLDHDRYADLFLADRPARTDGLPSLDRVLANPHGKGYVGQSVAGFDASGGADCLRPADLNKDGWTDIVLCERAMDRPGAYGIHILRNVKGRLVDVTKQSGITKRQAVDAIVTDMDGDGRPDIVEVTPYELRVHLQRNGRFVLGYTRPLDDAVAVAAGDVDGDHDKDLYVAQGSRSQQRPDLMLLNRGDGKGFRTMALPRTVGGSAESVTPIDYDRNGLTDFLVLNGKGALFPGPVQLIAFFPRK